MSEDIVKQWTTNRGDQVTIYQAEDGFRYRVQSRNNEIGGIGGEAYTELRGAEEAALRHHPAVSEKASEAVIATYEQLCFFDGHPCNKPR